MNHLHTHGVVRVAGGDMRGRISPVGADPRCNVVPPGDGGSVSAPEISYDYLLINGGPDYLLINGGPDKLIINT